MNRRVIERLLFCGSILWAISAASGQEPEELVSGTKPPPGVSASSAGERASQADRLKANVDLSFTNADLKNVITSLAKVYSLNIVAPDSVTGTVTLTLKGVTLEEGLRQLLKLGGFGFVIRGEIIEVVRLEEEKIAQVLTVKYLNPDTALEFLQPLASEKAVLKVDEASSGILVSDFLNKIEAMQRLLVQIDHPPRQVLIESKLIDITHTDLDNLGISLSSVGFTIPIKPESDPLFLASTALNMAGTSSDLTNDEMTFTFGRGSDTLTAAIDALIRDRKVKVIANPTVLAVNNVEAKIIIGEKFPIREQTQTTTGTLETTRFVDVGTTLRVTPRIDPSGYIQMHIHPEVSSVSSTLDEGPRITTREADTTVHVKDGQSIVIGGLLQEDLTLIKGRIPILGHLPFLGIFFQNRSKDHEQKELVIVITPRLVDVTAGTGKTPLEVQEVADRLDVSELFSQAEALGEKLSLQAREMPEVVRYLKAMDMYERVVNRFPSHPHALESLWKMGRIAREGLHDLNRAEAAYRRLITQFPTVNPYRRKAQTQIRLIRLERERKEGISSEGKKEEKPRRNPPKTNFGFH